MKSSERLVDRGQRVGDFWLVNEGKRVAKLEDVVDVARELRQSWREDGDGSVQECNALKKLHEALDALEEE